jgi:effector-associated domain 1 (EAD1)-containing protein
MLGSRMEELRDALCDAFDVQTLRELVRFRLNKDLAAIVPTDVPLSAVVFHLIDLASKEGWLADLVLAACEARPRKPALQAFRSDQEVLAAKLGWIEDKVNEQQKLINKLVETSISANAFRHLAGITILHEYKYWQNDEVGELFRREFYYLKDRGFIGPETQEFFKEMDGTNLVGRVRPTEIGELYITLRTGDVPKDWLSADPSKRPNLKVDVARGLGLEVPELE